MKTIDRKVGRHVSEDIYHSVETKLHRGNQILFDQESECLRGLIDLMGGQKHRTLVMWAFECAQAPLTILKARYPLEDRPGNALKAAAVWARGDIKMPEAKRAILDAHAFAKEIVNPVDIALVHAVGQAASTVHVATHALGLPFYELTSIVFEQGIDGFRDAVSVKINEYHKRLTYWQIHIDDVARPWAPFLLDGTNQKNRNLRSQTDDARRTQRKDRTGTDQR
ncbi:MAG: hypothetical protein A2Y16_00980 [Tenericutes bacterium GWF2_57_13]|nr:MAG: hypothetical protein A2Y16_00980 [Tenericutes bacterium GWF2_57_13]